MFDLKKIKIKLRKSKIKILQDKKTLHDIHISKQYLKDNFKFNFNENILSDKGIDRIFAFANYLEKERNNFKNNDMWNKITSNEDHKKLYNFCTKNNKDEFLKLLSSLGKTKLSHGFLNYASFSKLSNSASERNKEANQLLDKLLSLGEYRKKIKVYNPEQGGWIAENLDYEELIEKIFTFQGNKIKPFLSPNYTFGIESGKNFYCMKDFMMLYAGIKLDQISKNYKLKYVNEIGAGLGFSAYYFSKLNKNYYNIYDLPSVLILQAYFLMSSIGENKVHLSGERKNEIAQISLCPFWEIFDNESQSDILWYNHDALPEIDNLLAQKYIKKIISAKNSYFFSINQEARNDNSVGGNQHTVYDLIEKEGGYKLINRSRDFLRAGYIEELYSVN